MTVVSRLTCDNCGATVRTNLARSALLVLLVLLPLLAFNAMNDDMPKIVAWTVPGIWIIVGLVAVVRFQKLDVVANDIE